ncbi:hypothetical protein PoB_004935700 [Plakobranchus ocellatus]|uniref:Uncharacterized protein n=1 Tax=Plakobranchus ocellatus TaxID=259542 RepID=A0AAV4BTX8_9GAST|nr:hypothetical protein PoB_004935700 [Plakobranchus ocellatus]
MSCEPLYEQRIRRRYRNFFSEAQFIVHKNECKDLNGNCVPKDSKFSVISQGKRYDNCSCRVRERRYKSFAQKAKGFRFFMRYICEKKRP